MVLRITVVFEIAVATEDTSDTWDKADTVEWTAVDDSEGTIEFWIDGRFVIVAVDTTVGPLVNVTERTAEGIEDGGLDGRIEVLIDGAFVVTTENGGLDGVPELLIVGEFELRIVSNAGVTDGCTVSNNDGTVGEKFVEATDESIDGCAVDWKEGVGKNGVEIWRVDTVVGRVDGLKDVWTVGKDDGSFVGTAEVVKDGIEDGMTVVFVDGSNVGEDDGSVELWIVGTAEGGFEGEKVDTSVGTDVGA